MKKCLNCITLQKRVEELEALLDAQSKSESAIRSELETLRPKWERVCKLVRGEKF
jgi:hypothetical protein